MKNKNYQIETLPNGFRIAWRETSSGNVFANLRINHGALHEREGEEGIAHFLEHMFIEGGTEKYSPEEQAKIRGNFGYTNAFTSRDLTKIPWGMTPNKWEEFLDVSSQMVFHPRLDNKVLSQQKEIVLREMARKKGAPDFKDYESFRKSLARDRDHTYFVLGKDEVIRNLTQGQLRDFRARGYSPNNMILMVAGNISPQMISKIQEYFGNFPRGEGRPYTYSPVSSLEKKTHVVLPAQDLMNKDNEKNSNAQVLFGFVVPDELHEDSAALEVASTVYGRSKTRGLYHRIRSQEGISYDIGSFYSGTERFGRFHVEGKVIASKKDRAVEIVLEELEEMKVKSVDKDEIERAKIKLLYHLGSSLDGEYGKFAKVDPLNAGAIYQMNYDLGGGPDRQQRAQQIMKVTPADVRDVAQKYFPSRDGNYVLMIRDPLQR